MERLSQIIRGDYDRCSTCKALVCKQTYTYCPKIKKCVDWFISNKRTPKECPKRKKES